MKTNLMTRMAPLAAAVALSSIADSQIRAQADSVMKVGGQSFSSWHDYTHSQAFRNQGLRCKAPTPSQQKQFAAIPSDCGLNSNTSKAEYDPTKIWEIEVVFHVIQRTNGTGFISQALIESQMDILNQDFQAIANTPGANGTDTMIQFVLADQDPNGNATTGITYSTNNTWFTDGGGYFNQLAWDPARYMNVYTNNGDGALGYVPDLPQGLNVGSNSDRITMLWSTIGLNGPIGAPYNKGRTLTHEVGHYLGLLHTFSGGCGSSSACGASGDLICDTNGESAPNYGCGTGSSSCGSTDPVRNYMNYSDDTCMEEFTLEQMRRMRCTLQNWRPQLYTELDGGPTGGGDPLAQGFNIDIGGATVPGAGYGAAAGQAGTWTSAPSGAATGGGVMLTALDGSSSSVSLVASGGNGDFSFDNTSTSGNVERLLDDLQDAGSSTWTMSGLADGQYDVFAYSWAPDDRVGFTSTITIGGNAPQNCGAQDWSGSFVEGGHYVKARVAVSGGSLSVSVGQINGDPSSLNGLQIVPVDSVTGEVEVYCAPKVNSEFCGALIDSNGLPSASGSSFEITASFVLNQRNGLLFYGYGEASLPFQGGTLCVQPPLRRTAIQNSGGSTPPTSNCTGSFNFDMDAHIQSGIDPMLVEQAQVFAQYWYRDPGASFGAGLSNALRFVIGS